MKIDDATTRNAMADEIDAAVGATGAARFQNNGQTATYATCGLNNPAFGAAAAGAITLDVTPAVEDTTGVTTGTATRCGFYTAATGGTLIFTLGVATSGSPDMTISNNVFSSSDQVQISSLVITVPSGAADVT